MTTPADPVIETVADVAERRMEEYTGILPLATITTTVLRARRDLDRWMPPRRAPSRALDRLARTRLAALVAIRTVAATPAS